MYPTIKIPTDCVASIHASEMVSKVDGQYKGIFFGWDNNIIIGKFIIQSHFTYLLISAVFFSCI